MKHVLVDQHIVDANKEEERLYQQVDSMKKEMEDIKAEH